MDKNELPKAPAVWICYRDKVASYVGYSNNLHKRLTQNKHIRNNAFIKNKFELGFPVANEEYKFIRVKDKAEGLALRKQIKEKLAPSLNKR